MKAKQWIAVGSGCVAGAILVGFIVGLFWFNRLRSFVGDANVRPESMMDGFGYVLIGAALSNLLFFGGIITLIVGFIKLSKEPPRLKEPRTE